MDEQTEGACWCSAGVCVLAQAGVLACALAGAFGLVVVLAVISCCCASAVDVESMLEL